MADIVKILAQSLPPARTLTDAYIVPVNLAAVISSVVVCNESPSQAKFRLAVVNSGVADALSQYLFYDAQLIGNKTLAITIGVTIASAAVVRVLSDTGTVNFSIFGIEIA
jgi:hypothetical protein